MKIDRVVELDVDEDILDVAGYERLSVIGRIRVEYEWDTLDKWPTISKVTAEFLEYFDSCNELVPDVDGIDQLDRTKLVEQLIAVEDRGVH